MILNHPESQINKPELYQKSNLKTQEKSAANKTNDLTKNG